MVAAQPQKPIHMSESEYLAFDRSSELRHEYIAGYVYAMTGASWEHNMICSSIIATLYNQLRGKPCQVSPGDLRLKVLATGLLTYPDISVVCGEPIFVDQEFDTLTNPDVIIEILSPSTEAYDRGDKFQNYRQIESLQNYLLISQNKARIEGYTRLQSGIWTFTDAIGLDASFEISAIGCVLPLAEVYERVSFP
jgi:Uma2 family endonuclease